ncbi:galactose oxidase-like domain-containing protein [Nocardia sp. NPDC058666]|uniref:galactose oxidase-like domain-containing protein n=1 Tax=Nocardia sp. NPDC058666 TaxID=3346587 RepID=UPI0036544AD4
MPTNSILRRVALVAVLAVVVIAPPVAAQPTNVVSNAGMETLGGDGFPQCWEKSGWGTHDFTFTVTPQAHTGTSAMRIEIGAHTSGDRKAMMLESPACAPTVTVGHQYDLSVWYTTTTPNTVFTVFRHDITTGWQYWTDLASLPVAGTYTAAQVRTPVVPPNTDQISWGVTIYGTGVLTTDDYAMSDATITPEPPTCTGTQVQCAKGSWEVLAMPSPVRAVHAAVLPTGKVLLIAGSGNDPDAFAAGTFKTAQFDPATNQFTELATPWDVFCAGHAQLPDGKLLVMGGTQAYTAPEHGYKGLRDSYIFDPATSSYTRTNDMLAGHWYPSATTMGNGDILSLGGLGEDSAGTVVTERFSAAQNRWLGFGETKQTWAWWGLYPAMILLQDGRLFYSGAHVFGSGLDGTGASIYDYDAGTIVDVPGLQNKDERDQSMSVLLPPAQDQRVLTMGGGNTFTNPDANRLTDLIDLKQGNPTYHAGPPIPTGTLTGGVAQTAAQGKMYPSAVILPDGMVLETGGALHNRTDPVFEASMFDPATNTFAAGMATDPVPRGYHSSAFMLPDGRVMAVGENPADGSFDQRVSIYSPPYLFKGARPQITAVASQAWSYGSAQQLTVNGPVVKASLIRPAAVTHSSDPNQRYVDLPLTVAGGTLTANVTSNPNIAPPGWYMLTVVNAAGVPSVAQWIHLG